MILKPFGLVLRMGWMVNYQLRIGQGQGKLYYPTRGNSCGHSLRAVVTTYFLKILKEIQNKK